MSLDELAEAIVLEEDFDDLDDDDRLPKKEVLFDLCRGLVTFDSASRQVTLAHFSVKTYLTSMSEPPTERCAFFHIEPDEADKFLATQLIRYLMIPRSVVGFCDTSIVELLFDSWPLLSHAGICWPLHIKRLSEERLDPTQERKLDPSVVDFVNEFFATRKQENRGPYGFWLRVLNPSQRDPRIGQTEPLYYASSYGLKAIVRIILSNPEAFNINARGGRYGGTAIQAACYRRHLDVARMLLEAGANPNKPDDSGLSPMDYVVHNGPHEIAPLLKSFGGKHSSWFLRTFPGRGGGARYSSAKSQRLKDNGLPGSSSLVMDSR